MKVIVLGAGASGLMAAIRAAETGAQVTLIEPQKKAGKKLSVTGNGKCNFTNRKLMGLDSEEDYVPFYYGNHKLISQVLGQFGAEDVTVFFEQLGICSYVEKNYQGLYPKSNQAQSVTNALTDYARELHVKIKTNNVIHSISKTEDGFVVNVGIDLFCDHLIVATGGWNDFVEGISGYEIAKQLGHSVTELKPALTALIGRDELNKASGVRIQAKIRKETGVVQQGELQITDYGISGIPVFNLSHVVEAGDTLYIDFMPEYEEPEYQTFVKTLFQRLNAKRREGILENLLAPVLPEKLLKVLLKQANLSGSKLMKECSFEEFQAFFLFMKNYPFTVSKRRDFQYAQVTQGGVPLEELDVSRMESKQCPGLFLCGELLDVDGICGGYNLQWAWSTGYIAGENSSK